MVMFCGYLVCVCNKGWSQLHGQCVCDGDVVLVSCIICIEVLPLYYIIDLLDFLYFSFSLSAWRLFAIISCLFYN